MPSLQPIQPGSNSSRPFAGLGFRTEQHDLCVRLLRLPTVTTYTNYMRVGPTAAPSMRQVRHCECSGVVFFFFFSLYGYLPLFPERRSLRLWDGPAPAPLKVWVFNARECWYKMLVSTPYVLRSTLNSRSQTLRLSALKLSSAKIMIHLLL